jgi:hypothetical protein
MRILRSVAGQLFWVKFRFNTTQVLLYTASGTGSSTITDTAISNSAFIEFNFSYVADA